MSYRSVLDAIAGAAERVGRRREEVTLVAVSKSQSPAAVLAVYQEGHRDFGENRAGEMADKAAVLPTDIRWHFVGALQTNKTRLVRPITTLLHSLDRRSLALAWLKGAGMPPPVLVQINLGDESQKAGVPENRALAMVEMAHVLGLEVRGVMAIPPIPDNPESSRPYFRRLQEIGSEVRHRFPTADQLSMGMTDDFEVAIEEGASIIRVGRAIFGPRK
ncbi:MAG TPA: YggS family pyridoxal phosphate-dependent enzyme [Acidimicrobiia bacterium]